MEGKKEARDKFRLADQLFRDKDFAGALVVLDELNNEFPDTKNVIYPRAMCLARVERFDEALDLCRQLKVEFGDSRGESLMGKISALRKAKIDKEREKKESKTSGQSVQSPNVYTLDSNPPPLEERLKGKNLEFSPVFSPHGADPGSQPAEAGPEGLGGGADALDLGDGSPVIDMAALDELFAAKPAAPQAAAVKPAPPSRTGLYVAGGIAAVVLIALVALPLLLNGGGGQSEAPQRQQAPQGAPVEADQPAAPQFDGPEITWLTSIEAASSATGEDGRNVLLLFYSSSAPSSDLELMDSSVWNDPSIRYFAKNWVCAKIDVDADPETKDAWGISKLPTTILTDYAFEDQYYRQEGLVDAQQFYTAVMDTGLVSQAQEDTPLELPRLPALALALLPIFLILATFLPVLLTLVILGRMPEDDLTTGLLAMVLVGIVAPFLGMFVMRATYQLSRLEMLLYYGLLAVHLLAFNWVMTLLSGLDIPFYVYVYGLFLS